MPDPTSSSCAGAGANVKGGKKPAKKKQKRGSSESAVEADDSGAHIYDEDDESTFM